MVPTQRQNCIIHPHFLHRDLACKTDTAASATCDKRKIVKNTHVHILVNTECTFNAYLICMVST